jgi:hypothetical protein
LGTPKIKWLKQNRTNDYQLGRKSSPKTGAMFFLATEPCPGRFSRELLRSLWHLDAPQEDVFANFGRVFQGDHSTWGFHSIKKTGRLKGLTTFNNV